MFIFQFLNGKIHNYVFFLTFIHEISQLRSSTCQKTHFPKKLFSFAQFVYFLREVCLLFNFWMIKFKIMSKKTIMSPLCCVPCSSVFWFNTYPIESKIYCSRLYGKQIWLLVLSNVSTLTYSYSLVCMYFLFILRSCNIFFTLAFQWTPSFCKKSACNFRVLSLKLTEPRRALQPKGTQWFPRIGLFVVQVITLGPCRRPIEFLTSSHPCGRLSKIQNSQFLKAEKWKLLSHFPQKDFFAISHAHQLGLIL